MTTPRFIGQLLAGFAVTIFGAGIASARITLADQGRSDYTILLPDKAPRSVKAAAEELQKDIALASGAKLPIQADSTAGSASADQGTHHYISLGQTKQAKAAGFSVDSTPVEGWRIVTKDGNLYIFGPDTPDGGWTKHNGVSNGTAHGVYTFLEKEMGVRWLMPGDLGRVTPKQATLAVEEMDRSGAPRFHYRAMPYLQDYADRRQYDAIERWRMRMRVGKENGSVRISHGHSWWQTINRSVPESQQGEGSNTLAVKQLYAKHPDWFAMDAAGKRPLPHSKYNKLETTNPELVKWFAEQAIKHLKASDRPLTYSLSPSDGGGWSQSPQSKALYDPSPKMLDLEASSSNEAPSMSSLVLKWYHDVAQIVAKEYPQGRLAGYIYASYLYPPRKMRMKLPENFTPVIAPSFSYGYGLYRKQTQEQFKHVMEQWAKVAPTNWYYYDLPNRLGRQLEYEVGREGNFPGTTANITPVAPDILNFIFSTLVQNHIDGGYIYGSPSWSGHAMNNYVLAKMEWDPTLDAYAVQRDWLQHAYGKVAGATMERFYQKLDGWFRAYWNEHRDARYKLTLDMLRKIYAAHFPEMEQLFLQAQNQTVTQPQKQRLQLIGDNLIVLQWRLRNVGFLPANFDPKLKRSNEQVIAILEQRNEAFPMFAGVVGLDSRGYKKQKPATWSVQWDNSKGAADGQTPKLAGDTFLLYARKSGMIRIEPQQVRQSAYFASYEIKDVKGNVLKAGVFNAGTPVEFQARANQPYFLWVPPRQHVNYVLNLPNAGVAEGGLQNKTLHLHGPTDAPVQVFYAGSHAGLTAQEDGVKIIKPFAGAGYVAQMRNSGKYAEARVLLSLTSDWKFHPDPDNALMQKGVTRLDFNDSAWPTVSTLNWWQFQGFKDYHGPAWYRMTFDTPKLKKGEEARIYFGSVDGDVVVYLNGKKQTEHKLGPAPGYEGWNQAFSSHLRLEPSKKNILVVKVTSKNDTSASGITGGVAIIGRIKAR